MNHSLYDALPWTVILEANPNLVLLTKIKLLEAGVAYSDGYEPVKFSPKFFDADPVVNRGQTASGKPTQTIARTSYDVRVISLDTFKANVKELRTPDFAVCMGDVPPFASIPQQILQISEPLSRTQLLQLLS